MPSTLSRDVRFLKLYAVVSTAVMIVLLLSAFTASRQPTMIDELNVERINVVEPDGSLRMVISNQARQHPGVVNGKTIERSTPRAPGILFFNQLGDEMGGLTYGANGGTGHFGSLTFDKVRGDQTIGFRHLEGDDGSYSSGLELWQQPNVPGDLLASRFRDIRAMADTGARRRAIQAMRDADELTTQRLFLGKGRDNKAMLVFSDLKGRPRLRMSVTADGTAAIEFLDERGQVLSTLPAR